MQTAKSMTKSIAMRMLFINIANSTGSYLLSSPITCWEDSQVSMY